jgi:uncharacterized protein (TIRG00374 family)
MQAIYPDVLTNSPYSISLLQRKKLYKGLRYFCMFTIVSLAVLFYATSTRRTFAAFTHLEVRFLTLAALLQVLDIGLGAWRNHILVRKLKPGVSPWLCFRAQLANEFGAAITPGQSGGGPAWFYILFRGGIPPSSAIAVSVLVLLSTLIFFQVATTVSVLSLRHQFSGQVLLYLLRYGFLICTGVFLFILLSLWMPHRISRAITAITRTLRHPGRRWRTRLAQIGEGITLAIREYQSSTLLFFRKNRISVLQTFLITSLYYLGKLNLAYLILLGLGV